MADLKTSAETLKSIRDFLTTEPIYAGMIPTRFDDDFKLIDSGALDSIGIFNLVSFLEKKFSINVEPQDLNESNFNSIAAIERFVKQRRG